MKPKKSVTQFLMFCLMTIVVDTAFAQRLPEGKYHQNRQRLVDIIHYKADLEIDFNRGMVSGECTVLFSPLRENDELSLDAIHLNIDKVSLRTAGSPQDLSFMIEDQSLLIELGQRYRPADTLTVAILYSCQPHAGMYFQKDMANKDQYLMHTYGEGGLHANWLPIYSDVNDKFSTEMVITVPEPYMAISNGQLLGVNKKTKGQQTFHWKQTLPHANYLIAIYAGQFEKGELQPAFGSIPMSYWVPTGRLREGAYAFRNTPRMVEFFSTRLNYTYPWDKYDQIAVPDYAIGAMEHTGVTGHRWSVLREASAPLDFAPEFHSYHDFWSADGTIAHELAHHWFGDNLTCRNLSYIWLNESFASYCQMLWDEADLGKETLLLDRQIALDSYLNYVAREHRIRPLEYHNFDMPDDIYNEEHTYLKGAIVLHMLRNILGDDDFFQALHYYLNKYEFSNVESNDFKIAIEEATGQNLDWFFDDWIYNGGHPVFEVAYTYLPNHKLIDLSVKQVQPIVEGQGLFTLPVKITIATANGKREHTLWLAEAEEQFMLESESAPLMVSFDGEGHLVADIRFEKDIDELLYQIEQDVLPGRIRALRQLTQRFPNRAKTIRAISRILSGNEFWGMKAEAAFQLGTVRTVAAEHLVTSALQAQEYRIRKAAVLALPNFGSPSAKETIRNAISHDSHTDVVATAIVALAKADPEVEIDFIRKQIGRPSWYDEITIACLEAFGLLGKESLVQDIKPFVEERYNQHLRMAAVKAWENCAPNDFELHKVLMMNSERGPYSLQQLAIEMLGDLYVFQARPLLEKMARESGDVNIRVLAEQALSEIKRVEDVKR